MLRKQMLVPEEDEAGLQSVSLREEDILRPPIAFDHDADSKTGVY